MLTREEILKSPEYWFEEAQNELYRQVVDYKERKKITQTQLAEELGVTKGYVSQILKGEFNYTIKKLIEISLAIGKVPRIQYSPISKIIDEDAKIQCNLNGSAKVRRKNKTCDPFVKRSMAAKILVSKVQKTNLRLPLKN